MGSTTLSPSMKLMILFITLTFTLSLALDMSIISYDKTHPDKSPQRTNDQVLTMYEQWLVKHGKNYNALGEKETRFEIFKDNLRFIDEHNSQNLSFRLGLNRFADLTNEEYRTRFLGTRIDPNRRMKKGKSNSQTNRYATRVGDKLPESVDWRKEGAVVGVKDQGSCAVPKDQPVAVFLSMEDLALSGDVALLSQLLAVTIITVAALMNFPSSKNNPLGVKSFKRTPAKPHFAIGGKNKMGSV
ncbi:hypothetical protein RYX36_022737 [Vicia faba]